MRILALDVSTKTGWAVFDDDNLVYFGRHAITVDNFNVNDFPDQAEEYPENIATAAQSMCRFILTLLEDHKPDRIVIENTVKGRNRHTQRILEWIHHELFQNALYKFWASDRLNYRDPSWWRSKLEVRMSNEDKKNNRHVREGKKRGKVTVKHLSVRKANELFGKGLKIKDNDIADAMLLGLAQYKEMNP